MSVFGASRLQRHGTVGGSRCCLFHALGVLVTFKEIQGILAREPRPVALHQHANLSPRAGEKHIARLAPVLAVRIFADVARGVGRDSRQFLEAGFSEIVLSGHVLPNILHLLLVLADPRRWNLHHLARGNHLRRNQRGLIGAVPALMGLFFFLSKGIALVPTRLLNVTPGKTVFLQQLIA